MGRGHIDSSIAGTASNGFLPFLSLLLAAVFAVLSVIYTNYFIILPRHCQRHWHVATAVVTAQCYRAFQPWCWVSTQRFVIEIDLFNMMNRADSAGRNEASEM